jgi:hypothetical protein
MKYLYPVTVTTEKPDVGGDYNSAVDAVNEREEELAMALDDFLTILLMDFDIESNYGHGFAEQVLDDFCEYLANDHLVSVYRPTFPSDDFGEEKFTEYPYGELTGLMDDDEEDDTLCKYS